MFTPDVLVVGAGIFGLTVAERLATQGKRVLVIDKRSHIGGNAYSEIDTETGIEVHKYGAHIFHTSDKRVWDYIRQFSDFSDYQHRVYTTHNGEVYPMPINLGTINQFFRANYSPEEARTVIKGQASEAPENPRNLAEQGISLIGKPLFDAFIKGYTEKQWQTPAEELSPEIIKRLPVRYNYNNRYFNDAYEGLPAEGYEKMFQEMIKAGGENIQVQLGVDYLKNNELTRQGVLTVYTGAIDQFFGYKFGELKWRSLEFEKEIVSVEDYQGCAVMNYADLDVPYTRIHEFKHFHPEKKHPGKTVIVREYSKTWKRGDEPYYPVNTAEDRERLAKYEEEAKKIPNVVFGGRLGKYRYLDMDKTIGEALEVAEKLAM